MGFKFGLSFYSRPVGIHPPKTHPSAMSSPFDFILEILTLRRGRYVCVDTMATFGLPASLPYYCADWTSLVLGTLPPRRPVSNPGPPRLPVREPQLLHMLPAVRGAHPIPDHRQADPMPGAHWARPALGLPGGPSRAPHDPGHGKPRALHEHGHAHQAVHGRPGAQHPRPLHRAGGVPQHPVL